MKKLMVIALAMTIGYFSADAKGKKSPCTVPTAAIPVSYSTTNTTPNYPYRRHNILVWTDDMNNPYQGKESRQNDGLDKLRQRNMNVVITSTGGYLPPSDGSNR